MFSNLFWKRRRKVWRCISHEKGEKLIRRPLENCGIGYGGRGDFVVFYSVLIFGVSICFSYFERAYTNNIKLN
jgi:hypothetical protein